MKKFYTPQKSISSVSFNHITNDILTAVRRGAMIFLCLCAGMCIFDIKTGVGQSVALLSSEESGSAQLIAGKWLLQDIKILENGMEVSKESYSKCFWIDHKNIPLIISGDGSVEYSKEGKPMGATVKVEAGKLVFYFPMGNVTKVSDTGEVSTSGNSYTSTTYDFNVSGNKLTLRREDPEFFKQFVFKRQ